MEHRQKLLEELIEKGFTVENGKVYSLKKEISLHLNKEGYYCFSHRMKDGKTRSTGVHRLVAFIKYGYKIFENGIQVRHLDGNSKNNSFDNILIGTGSENCLDKSIEVRKKVAIQISPKIHNHKEIIKRRKDGATYKDLMNEFNISSKGTISYIINKSIDKL